MSRNVHRPPRHGRVCLEVALDAADDRAGHRLLVALVLEPRFFFRVGDERRLDQDRRDVRRLEHRETRLLDARLVQGVDALELAQHRRAELQAVVDLRRGRQVEQHARDLRIVAAEVDAADQVGVVFLARHPRGGRRTGAALRQGEHRGAARIRTDPGIGVDRDEQVRLHAPRLGHALAESDEVVAVAREHHAHAALSVDQPLDASRDRQRDMLLVGAAAADRARVLAAMAGIDRHGDEARHVVAAPAHLQLGCRGLERLRRRESDSSRRPPATDEEAPGRRSQAR